MDIQVLLYSYLAVCLAMIIFNIVTAIVLRRGEEKTLRFSKTLRGQVEEQLNCIKNDGKISESHKHYMYKTLKRIGNMIAFDKMLEEYYEEDPESIREYLQQLDSVFIGLTAKYCKKDKIEMAYFPYIVKKYLLIENKPFSTITEIMVKLLAEPSIFCRENAMQAIYTTADVNTVLTAIKKIDASDMYYNDKLISDGLLGFTGNNTLLGERIVGGLNEFSDPMKVILLNYLRFSNGNYQEFVYQLLCDKKQYAEIRYSCIRYLGKYPYEKARRVLQTLAGNRDSGKWEYAAIASNSLVSYPGDDTVDILKNNLYSRNWYIRFNSANSLNRLGCTYTDLADVIDGNDRFASEALRYRFEKTHFAKKNRKEA